MKTLPTWHLARGALPISPIHLGVSALDWKRKKMKDNVIQTEQQITNSEFIKQSYTARKCWKNCLGVNEKLPFKMGQTDTCGLDPVRPIYVFINTLIIPSKSCAFLVYPPTLLKHRRLYDPPKAKNKSQFYT